MNLDQYKQTRPTNREAADAHKTRMAQLQQLQQIREIREIVARTIYTTPSEALKGMAEILHIIDGT